MQSESWRQSRRPGVGPNNHYNLSIRVAAFADNRDSIILMLAGSRRRYPATSVTENPFSLTSAASTKDLIAVFLSAFHGTEKEGGSKMDFEKAKLNPAVVFKSPQEVVSSQELSREQKIEILRQWEQEARLMEVAEEEGMPGPQPKLLQPIRDALHALNYWPDPENSSPSKA